MTKIRPEMEISGRFLVSGQKMHIFWAGNNFGQNGRNFCLPAEFKVKNLSNLIIFWIWRKNIKGHNMAGNRNFWPIFSVWTKLIIFWPEKNFFTKRPKFLHLGWIWSQNCQNLCSKYMQFIEKSHIFGIFDEFLIFCGRNVADRYLVAYPKTYVSKQIRHAFRPTSANLYPQI